MSDSKQKIINDLSNLGNRARMLIDRSDSDLYQEREVTKNYEVELTQIAAASLRALVDLKRSQPNFHNQVITFEKVMRQVLNEKERQELKFPFNSESYDPFFWIVILLEELAEAAEEIDMVM